MRINEHGYPTKKTISGILSRFGIDTQLITFNAMYDEGRRVSILYTRSDLRMITDEIAEELKRRGVQIKRIKKGERVHSIWLDPIDIPEN